MIQKLELAEKNATLPKIVVAVHLCGQPCAMDKIHALSKRYGFRIIEDAAHAIGGRYKDTPIGSCHFSDITIFSFHPVKIITTGEGGMAVTNNAQLADKMALLRSHGITRDPDFMTCAADGPWYYQQIELGYNYRMTDIQAALGISQMKRLDQYIARRHAIATRYNNLLSPLPVTIPYQHPNSYSGLHLYIIRLQLEQITPSHRQVFEALREQEIGANLHYIPIHTQPYYQQMGFRDGQYPQAESYYREAISLPMYPKLTEKQQDKVVAALIRALKI